jgi:hypothetical protein
VVAVALRAAYASREELATEAALIALVAAILLLVRFVPTKH